MELQHFDVVHHNCHLHVIFRQELHCSWEDVRKSMDVDFELLVRSCEPYVVLDFSHVALVGGGLVGKLVMLGRALQSHGRRLLLCNIKTDAGFVLSMPSGPPQWTIFQSYNEACSFIGSKA